MISSRYFRLCQTFRYYSTTALSIKKAITSKPLNTQLLIQGWVQSVRKHKDIYFVDVVDGSCFGRLQIIVEADDNCIPAYGSSVSVEGELVPSSHKGQEVELICKTWKSIGACSKDFPFANRTKCGPEHMREFPHLRPKTKTFASMLRIRSCATQAIHNFYEANDFHLIHTPIITLNDCEGAGEVFLVQSDVHKEDSKPVCKGKKNLQSKNDMLVVNDSKQMEGIEKTHTDSSQFFGAPAFLTVSSQFHLEAISGALSRVYSFSPVFRAETSRSRQHASEFYMIEAEMAFIENLKDLTKQVEKLIKHVVATVLTKCSSDINSVRETSDARNHNQYITKLVEQSFVHMTYSEAIAILETNQKKLKTDIKFGEDFSSEQKQFLTRHCGDIPLILTMFPSAIKPFYMKEDSNGMAFCFDVFAPFGGEICGGSLRESTEEILANKLEKLGLKESLSWYLDLRKYGSVPHGGYGIGFDRLLQCILGVLNINDVIPFPRRSNDCKC